MQYRLPKKTDALVQHFGCVGHDPSIQATAILLVEKTYFSKPELEHWASIFEDIPSVSLMKQKQEKEAISPQKRTILGKRRNTHPTTDEAIEDALNAEVSPEELQAWAEMSMNLVNKDMLTSYIQNKESGNQEEAGDTRSENDMEVRSDDGGEEVNVADLSHGLASHPSKQQEAKGKSMRVQNGTKKPL